MSQHTPQREDIDAVFERLYEELKAIARWRMKRERIGHTLGATGLLNEAYLRVVESSAGRWQDDHHFRALVSLNMDRVLKSYGRRRGAAKRRPTPDTSNPDPSNAHDNSQKLLQLQDAMDRLPARFAEGDYYRQLVTWIDLLGMTQEEAGERVQRSSRTVRSHLAVARLSLRQILGDA